MDKNGILQKIYVRKCRKPVERKKEILYNKAKYDNIPKNKRGIEL